MFDFVFLGTGAMKPTPKRFTSSIMVRYGGEIIMFDAGEGIQVRVSQSGFSPMKVNKIFITHFHGDHFYGLPGMIFTMAKGGRSERLEVYGPPGAKKFVQGILSLGYGRIPFDVEVNEMNDGDRVNGDGYYIQAFEVNHGPPSIGYIFKENNGVNVDEEKMKKEGLKPSPKFRLLKEGQEVEINGKILKPRDWLIPVPGDSLAYTGDTRYSEKIARAVSECTVLVHEATYMEGDSDEFDKGHSSVTDAAKTAKKAGVKKLFLIHISPRYRDKHPLVDEAKKIFPQSEVPDDLDEGTLKKGVLERIK
jgi:ribonuclease Z